MSEKIGYIVVSHGDDYRRLKLTLCSTNWQSDRIAIVWSGKSEQRYEVKNFIDEVLDDYYPRDYSRPEVILSETELKCLKARKVGFDKLTSLYPDIKYIQFIDSGDYLRKDEDSWKVNELDKYTEDLFWAPVRILGDELEDMIKSETDYTSCLENESRNGTQSYNSWDYDEDNGTVDIIKEDYDKINEVNKLISITDGWNDNLTIYANDCWYELGTSDNPEARRISNKKNVEHIINTVTFSMQCPAIISMPWRVEVVKKTFDAIPKLGMDYDVNIAEDLLFHTVARHLYKNEDNRVSCKVLGSSYTYRYYPDSLTHRKHDDKDLLELCKIRGFCANLINGNITPNYNVEVKSNDVNPEKDEDCIVENINEEFDAVYMGIPIVPICFKGTKKFDPTESWICWNDGEPIVVCAVLMYIPGAKFCVVTADKVYQHIAKMPSRDLIKKSLPKWSVIGMAKKTNNHPEIDIHCVTSWDGNDIKTLKMSLATSHNIDDWTAIIIISLTRLGVEL